MPNYCYAENESIRVRIDSENSESAVEYLIIDNQYLEEGGWCHTPFYGYEFRTVKAALNRIDAWLEDSFSN